MSYCHILLYLFCASLLTRYRSRLTELSFSWRPSPLGSDDLRFVEEFLFGVELAPPAFFLTKRTSQLAWSSLCVLFPAFITLRKNKRENKSHVQVSKGQKPLSVSPMWLKMYRTLAQKYCKYQLNTWLLTHIHIHVYVYTYAPILVSIHLHMA